MALSKIGSWAFIIGMILAVIMGFVGTGATTTWILALLGLIVGFLNVTHTEAKLYLVASIAFLLSAQSLGILWTRLEPILQNITIFVATGAAVVSFRAFYDIAKVE